MLPELGLSSGFRRNVAVLVTGTALAQCITLAASPFLSRLYPPAAFGLWQLFYSWVGILAAVSVWRYETAIVIPERDEDAANLAAAGLGVVLFMTVVTGLLVLALADAVATWLEAPPLARLLRWAPVAVFAHGIFQVANYWSVRRKAFQRVAAAQVTRALGTASAQSALATLQTTGTSLVAGQVLGQTLATCILGLQSWRTDGARLRTSLALRTARRLAVEYRDFPLYNGTVALLNATSQNLPAFLLAFFFGSGVVGLVALALRLLQAPVNLIGESVRQAFLQRASEARNRGEDVYRLGLRATLAIMAATVLPTLVLVLYGPHLFAFVLGSEWREAGEYSRWLVLWLACLLANPPAYTLVQIYRVQYYLVVFDVLLLVARVAAIVTGGLTGNAVLSIALYSTVGVVFNLSLIVLVLLHVRRARG